jgi:hypothetical protein
VTFDPGSIDKPDRLASIVSVVFGVKSPRNCRNTSTAMMATITYITTLAVRRGGSQYQCLNRSLSTVPTALL